ncbi:AP2 domain-containing protein [Bacillus cereus]|nr:AP2 domain-containing protein [Bacillus cereus]
MGQRFGRLIVIGESELTTRSHDRYVLCKCDCGKNHNVTIGNLKKGDIRSCGCLYKEQQLKNLIGKKFNRLSVVNDSGKRTNDNRVIWSCICECGNNVEVTTYSLTTGSTKSCGCLAVENSHEMANLINEKYWREGTRLDNLQRGIQRNNTSGIKGVSYIKKRNKWRAQLVIKGKRVLQKDFINKEDAIKARKEAEEKYHMPILEKYK